ncbi:hypothetical protein E2C01_023999 [Portunus trituberculatus]|uniref:Uncharacterized protein n=1 Tax=Portunus trituberculatus TaxID=210409 RepID=A0A5B7EBJ4_PORTR|nr:hypothetical protein [Portunus trituberculatus]
MSLMPQLVFLQPHAAATPPSGARWVPPSSTPSRGGRTGWGLRYSCGGRGVAAASIHQGHAGYLDGVTHVVAEPWPPPAVGGDGGSGSGGEGRPREPGCSVERAGVLQQATPRAMSEYCKRSRPAVEEHKAQVSFSSVCAPV